MRRGRSPVIGAGAAWRPPAGRALARAASVVAALAAAAVTPGVVGAAAASAAAVPVAGAIRRPDPPLPHARDPLPRSALAVRYGGAWHTWWSSAEAPERWARPLSAVARAARWQPGAPGVEWARLRLAGRGEAWRLGVVLVRIDPRLVRLELASPEPRHGGWTIDAMPDDAVVALNAGQFADGVAWGWIVRAGREVQAPGTGSLAAAVVVDTTGAVRIVDADSVAAVRARGGIREAFQSYPALLTGDGHVPAPLLASGLGVDVGHRDARLAVGELRDGRILVALTRFEGLGGVLEHLPLGPTVPEMAALMGALDARRAVLLDGGISSQLAVRSAFAAGSAPEARRAGVTAPGGAVAAPRRHAWPGMRRVPLALLGFPAP